VNASLRQRGKAMGGGFGEKREADHDQSGQRRIGKDDAPIDPGVDGRKFRTQLSPKLRVHVAHRPPGSPQTQPRGAQRPNGHTKRPAVGSSFG
jgi:hypothetical protein